MKKKIVSIKQIKSIRPDLIPKSINSINSRIAKVREGAKLPSGGDRRLPPPRQKAVRKYNNLADTIRKIPTRKPKLGKEARLKKIETNVKFNGKQPKGVYEGHRNPVLSKPQAKAIAKLGGNVTPHSRPVERKSKLPGRGTPERANLAKQKRDALNAKKLRRFGNQTDVRMYRNKKGTALGRPEKLKSLLNRRKANKNLYQGLEGL
jgi:hypothetical protein